MIQIDPRCFVERAIIKATLDKPGRWCVVLRVDGNWLTVAYGQRRGSQMDGSAGPRDFVVRFGSGENRRFKCKCDTYFRPTNVTIIHRNKVTEHMGTCASDHLLTLLEFDRSVSLTDAPITTIPSHNRGPRASSQIPTQLPTTAQLTITEQPTVASTSTPQAIQMQAQAIRTPSDDES